MRSPKADLARARKALAERPDLANLVLLAAEPLLDQVMEPAHAAKVFLPMLLGRETEALAACALDQRNRVIGTTILTTGSSRFTVVDPCHIFRWALTCHRRMPSTVLIAHNHPSGDPAPSVQDREVTRRVASAGRTLGIRLADHLIIADPGRWVSLAELGELPPFHEQPSWTA